VRERSLHQRYQTRNSCYEKYQCNTRCDSLPQYSITRSLPNEVNTRLAFASFLRTYLRYHSRKEDHLTSEGQVRVPSFGVFQTFACHCSQGLLSKHRNSLLLMH
jgi:hypothetical protein